MERYTKLFLTKSKYCNHLPETIDSTKKGLKLCKVNFDFVWLKYPDEK